ncbi:unnamed protein product [Dibothriocephalus latus]|uniref:HP domain-containing protein n=1 Tax=Dibothriocephalus latus TaxID=60516 RepID=A0A3P7L754_DIBLA|nr:unnamed protein product [Dibothriocephalus latus]
MTAPSMTCSLPVGAGTSFLSTGTRLNCTGTIDEEKSNNVDGTPTERRQENGLHLSNGYGLTQSQYSPQRTTRPSFRTNGAGGDGERDLDHIIGSSPSYPSVLYASTPSAVFKQVPPPPVREVSYKDLTSGGGQWPKGLDITKLETYLSDAEFNSVFNLSRVAFYRLPEWKRNDLKRRPTTTETRVNNADWRQSVNKGEILLTAPTLSPPAFPELSRVHRANTYGK